MAYRPRSIAHGVRAALAVTLLASSALAATFTVNTTSDDVDADLDDDICETVAGGGDCSLRAAVQQANATDGTDDIVLPDGIVSLITPGDDDTAVAGDLDINESVTIRGAGADVTIVNGGRLDRVFDIDPGRVGGVTVEIQGLTIQDGSAALGGGIQSRGSLTLREVAISDNIATGDGGGIFSVGALTVIDSLVSENRSVSDGAGVYSGAALTITNSTVSGNTASGSAGGIDSRGTLTMRFSTVAGNGSTNGAGGLVSRTVSTNASVGSTIIASNIPVNCTQAVTSADHNVESSNTCGFTAPNDQRDADPELCPLDYYGGTTHTHALPATSAARDTGAPANCPVTDQRGLPRPVDGDGASGAACDVGAFEAQQIGGACEAVPTRTRPPATPTATDRPATEPPSTPTPTATLSSGCPGDCNGSDTVSVDELVRGVNIALGRADVDTCPVLDRDASGTVAVNELVTAVNNALRGCP